MLTNLAITLIDLVVIFHAVITIAVVIGAFLAVTNQLRNKRHLERIIGLIAGLIILSYIATGACVLTTFEKFLRASYFPDSVYSNGFIAHYLSFLGIHISDLTAFWIITSAITIGALATIYHRLPRGKKEC